MTGKKKDAHLLVSPAIHRLAKIESAKAGIDLTRATEALWLLWVNGVVVLEAAMVKELIESSQRHEEIQNGPDKET